MSEAEMVGGRLMSLVDLERPVEELSRVWKASGQAERRGFLDDLLTETLLTEVFRERAEARGRLRVRWTAGLAAAGLLIAAVVGWMTWEKTGYPQAELSGDFTVMTPDGKVVSAREMERGCLVKATGETTLRMEGLYVLTLEGGTEAVWRGGPREEEIGLDLGRMRSVVEAGKGKFKVTTPRGSLEVVGTDFVTEVTYEGKEKKEGATKASRMARVSVVVTSGAVWCEFDEFRGVLRAGMSKVLSTEVNQTAAVAEHPAEERPAERQTGELTGVVAGVDALKIEGVIRLALRVTREGETQEMFVVGPGNVQGFALVGTLKAGEKVRLGWVSENGVQKWIRNIRRMEGEGERREGEQREGERQEGTR